MVSNSEQIGRYNANAFLGLQVQLFEPVLKIQINLMTVYRQRSFTNSGAGIFGKTGTEQGSFVRAHAILISP